MSYVHEAPADAACESADARTGQLAKALRLFETFAGFPAPHIGTRRIDRVLPEVLVDMGALRGLVYSKDLGGTRRTYIHFMDDPPRLLCDAAGRQLYIVGGSYRVTRRGIEG
jgi:hypothetical protein